jgi:hypothetical protein
MTNQFYVAVWCLYSSTVLDHSSTEVTTAVQVTLALARTPNESVHTSSVDVISHDNDVFRDLRLL